MTITDRPLVSVISPQFGDATLYRTRCLPSVMAQTYPNIEHIVVVNGASELDEFHSTTRRIVHLGRNWHSFTPNPSYGVIPTIVGTALARGKYITYCDHDDEMLPGHVERLVDLLERTNSDWVYSRMAIRRRGLDLGEVIGSPKPAFTRISGQLLLHKAEMLNIAQWDPSCEFNKATLPPEWQHAATYAADWDLIGRWLKSPAKWAHLPEVTVIHHRDNLLELMAAGR